MGGGGIMFGSKKTIIYITREKIKAGNVVLGKQPKVEDVAEYDPPAGEAGWTPETIADVLQKIKNSFKAKKVRVLLDDELSYVLLLKKPEEVTNERRWVAEQIAARIPEEFIDSEWDFREVRLKGEKENKILVFAPVEDFFVILSKVIKEVKIKVEAIEPVKLASMRHKDPIIGLAMKKDLKGKDEEVLNIDVDV